MSDKPPIRIVCDATNYIVRYCAATRDKPDPKGCSRGLMAAALGLQNAFPRGGAGDFCFDSGEPTWREERFPEWKGGREKRSVEIPGVVESSEIVRTMLQQAGMRVWVAPGYEADDLCATVARRWLDAGDQVVVWSTDKDYYQLLESGRLSMLPVCRRLSRSGGWERKFMTEGDLLERCKLSPAQWPDFVALGGDNSDGWPGADGVGGVTALRLITHYGTLAATMDGWQDGAVKLNRRQKEGMVNFRGAWQLGLDLMTLKRDVSYERCEV